MEKALPGFIVFMALVGSLGLAAIISSPSSLYAWVAGSMIMGYCYGAATFAWIFGRRKE